MTAASASVDKSARVLVTGGTGFVGAYIIRELVQQGYAVKAIRRSDRLPFFIEPEILQQVNWIPGDILDYPSLENAMQHIDVVVHAAAKISFAPTERKEMYKTNIEGTANVVNAALDQGIKKFVYISSVASLGRLENGALQSEGKPWDEVKTQTHYAASKYHAEMEVWRAIGEGLPAVIVNPSTVIGFGDWNTGSCAIFKTVYRGLPWYPVGATGFVDVQDLARSVVMLMNADILSERFLLNGENLSFRQLFNQIADGFSRKHPVWEATPFLGGLAWRWENLKTWITGKPSVLTRESARIAQGVTRFDNQKLKKFLPGFEFTPVQESIRQSCLAYLNNLTSAAPAALDAKASHSEA